MGVMPLARIGPKPGEIASGSKLEDARRSMAAVGQCGVESGCGSRLLLEARAVEYKFDSGAGVAQIWRRQERVVARVLPVASRVQPVGDLS